jgi:CDP-glucose 4,6-dehydratase
MDFAAIYRGRRVVLTGHTGFKGSWLALWLNRLGAHVTGIALPPASQPNLFEAIDVSGLVESHLVDIRDAAKVSAIVKAAQPEIVFHLAAQPLVRRSYADPLETFSTNIMGTAHVLEACRASGSVRAFVSVTTDKVYESQEWPWPYRESDRLGGADPYSASKACAELVTAVYRDNVFRKDPAIAVATARGGNVLGGGDWSEDRIVPDVVRSITSGRPIVLRNPAAVRPWQHVLELCEGYLELGARLSRSGFDFAEAWNFGPQGQDDAPVLALAKQFLATMGKPEHPIEIQGEPLKETQLLRLDISKALSRLDWRPRLTTRETLEWSAEWYRACHAGEAMREVSLRQVAAFDARRTGG